MAKPHQTVHLIGLPVSLGAGKRGMDSGPSALRIADLRKRLESLGYPVRDEGDILITSQEVQEVGDTEMRYLPEIKRVSELLATKVEEALSADGFPLVLGGDHSMSIGSLAGIGAYCKRKNKKLGVVWVDAHPDMNTPETSPSGNIHGMPLAVAMGYGAKELTSISGDFPKVQPKNVVIIGARDIDKGEAQLIKKLKVNTYTMYEIDKSGVYKIMKEIVEEMQKRVDHLHVSFDVDSVDPSIAPGVGTPVSGGLSYREAHFIMEALAETGMVASMDVAEVNPILDEHNRTAIFAAEIVSSCMGKRIM
jgi:arginase